MISDQSHHFLQSLSGIGLCICNSVPMKAEKHAVALLPCLPWINTSEILQKYINKRRKDEVTEKQRKVVTVEVKMNVIRMTDHGTVDAALFGRLKICKREEYSEGNLPA